MSLVVAKFGGTSLADLERIRVVAGHIASCRDEGHDVVVVVSAMAGDTDRLIGLGTSVVNRPDPREMDVLLAAGEQVSVALVAMAVQERGMKARSFLASQIRVRTVGKHMKAKIQSVEVKGLQEDIASGVIPVIAGFQGIGADGDLTTIGRGGSDTTAVAVAAALEADECRIYTDVEGVHTADPRIVEHAQKLDRVVCEEMLEMAALGAKVLHTRCVEYAHRYSVPLRVLSSFQKGSGTLICEEGENDEMERPVVSAVTHDRNEAKLTVTRVPDKPGLAYRLLGPIGEAGISVDMIVQNVGVESLTDMTFTVKREDYQQSQEILRASIAELSDELSEDQVKHMNVVGDDSIAKVTVVGVGMRSHAGVATTMFETLAHYGINIQMISTSEIKISVIIHEDFCELAVRALHSAFELDVANPLAN
ncbi:MAG: aspartate kinase [Gammaproteobacteria bacterium]|nr:aspartate kinase [Gammaproteobacteria bacterium]